MCLWLPNTMFSFFVIFKQREQWKLKFPAARTQGNQPAPCLLVSTSLLWRCVLSKVYWMSGFLKLCGFYSWKCPSLCAQVVFNVLLVIIAVICPMGRICSLYKFGLSINCGSASCGLNVNKLYYTYTYINFMFSIKNALLYMCNKVL